MNTTLQDIIEDIYLETKSIDSLFRNKRKIDIVRYAKRGLNELNLNFATHLMGMNVRVPMTCRVEKPSGYHSFVRAYVISCDGQTIELSRNENIPDEIFHYILNCDGSLIKDNCGNELYDNCIDCDSGVKFSGGVCDTCNGVGKCLSPESASLLQSLEQFKDSWIKVKSHLNYFEFSSDLEDVAVVIEYISDNTTNIDECTIVVDEEFKNALDYYIKFKLLENGLETMQQAQYYNRKFKALRDRIKFNKNAMSKHDLYSLLLKK